MLNMPHALCSHIQPSLRMSRWWCLGFVEKWILCAACVSVSVYPTLASHSPRTITCLPTAEFSESLNNLNVFGVFRIPAVEASSTIHLVRSMASAPPPASTRSPTAAAAPFSSSSGGTTGGAPGTGTPGSNPLADMMGSMGGAGSMDINRMQQQLMSNPEMMASIMNSPMMEVRLDVENYVLRLESSGEGSVGGGGIHI